MYTAFCLLVFLLHKSDSIFTVCLLADAMVEPVSESINFPSEEEKILQLWKEKDCFQECLKQSKNRPR